MSKRSEIEEKVRQVVCEQLDVDVATIKNDQSFIEDLGADSLDVVELVMAMEEQFNLEIPDEQAETIVTVQHAVDYIMSGTGA